MAGWDRHAGKAAGLPLENVDTDQLIPARFMSAPRSEGYGRFLLHDLRRDADGALLPDFPLNTARDATVLVAGRNFGTGSSREAAVYALVDAGFRAVLAPGFGDIFASNAVNNGLLPGRIGASDAATLLHALGQGPAAAEVDLQACKATVAGQEVAFEIDPVWRTKLINGWDDIDLTASHRDEIAAFRARRLGTSPWAWPAAGRT